MKPNRIFIAVLIVSLIIVVFLLLSNKQQSAENSTIKCPSDYCEPKVWGSGPCPFWTNQTGRYYEQKCYDYPEKAHSKEECEANKIVFYKICGVRAG